MATKTTQATIKIELTPEQREQARQVLGKQVSALDLKPEELEERIAPAMKPPTGNSQCPT